MSRRSQSEFGRNATHVNSTYADFTVFEIFKLHWCDSFDFNEKLINFTRHKCAFLGTDNSPFKGDMDAVLKAGALLNTLIIRSDTDSIFVASVQNLLLLLAWVGIPAENKCIYGKLDVDTLNKILILH